MGTKTNPGEFDCYEKAEPDEPRFTLLGRDASAPALVEQWALRRDLAILSGQKPESDQAQVKEAMACAAEMRAFRARRHSSDKPLPPLVYRPCLEPPYFAANDEEWDQKTGKPGIGHFADAIQSWSLMQNRETTIEEGALVFNVPIEMVRSAVEWHPWMLLEGKNGSVIGHAGE